MEELIRKLRELQNKPENKWNRDYQRAIADAIRVIPDEEETGETETIKVSRGVVKAVTGRFVVYDRGWLRKNFFSTEAKIYEERYGEHMEKHECVSYEVKTHEESDYISRKAAIEGMRFTDGYMNDNVLYVPIRDVRKHLRELPSVHPGGKVGRWIPVNPQKDVTDTFKCSVCGGLAFEENYTYLCIYDYCPWCRAEMLIGG